MNNKILKSLDILLPYNRKVTEQLILICGKFDPLHEGHKYLFYEAKVLGGILLVLVNSDSSIKKLGYINRPYQSQDVRSEAVADNENVDYVYIFDETEVSKYILMLEPDFFVKGDDYSFNTINSNERDACFKVGTQIHIIKRLEGFKSTEIINNKSNVVDDKFTEVIKSLDENLKTIKIKFDKFLKLAEKGKVVHFSGFKSRKASIELRKLFIEYRKLSLKYEKYKFPWRYKKKNE